MFHVYLIYPRSPYASTEQWNLSFYTQLLGRTVVSAPPLGLAVLAAVTPSDIVITATDENVSPVLMDIQPNLVGISYHTASAPRAYELARHFRSRQIPVVLGGIHASSLPEEALQHGNFVIVGEAEDVWCEFLRDFRNGCPSPIYYGRPCHRIPMPRWDIFPASHYLSNTIQASRGCRFDCDFCCVKEFSGKDLRLRPVDDVIAEIATNRTHPWPKVVAFGDNDIMADVQWASELAGRIRPLCVNWTGYTTSNRVVTHPELVKNLADSGCLTLVIGFESLSEESLRKSNKYGNQLQKYHDVVRIVQDSGIAVVGSFVLGLEGDTPDIFRQTAEFIGKEGILLTNLSILTPYPGTRYYKRLESQGRILHHDWGQYDRRHVCYQPARMSAQELQDGFLWLENTVRHSGNFEKRLRAFLAKTSHRPSLHTGMPFREISSGLMRSLFYLRPASLRLLLKTLIFPGLGPQKRRIFYTFAGI